MKTIEQFIRQPTDNDKQGFNQRWYAPNLQNVYVPTNYMELQMAIQDATDKFGSDIKIFSSGHCYENFIHNSDTKAIIDLSTLNQIGFDKNYGFFIESGAGNWQIVTHLLKRYNRCLPSGSCYSVAAGGHISGGGYGLLSRLHGLTVDWVTGLDVVAYQNGNFVKLHLSADENPDLFWALRGGGAGSFCAVYRFYFRELPQAPANGANIWILGLDWSEVTSRSILKSFIEFIYAIQSRSNRFFALGKLNHISAGELHLVVQLTNPLPGEVDDLTIELNKRGFGIPKKPILGHPGYIGNLGFKNSINNFTFLESCQFLNGSGPNVRGKYKSAYMIDEFTEYELNTIYDHLTYRDSKADLSSTLLQVDTYGGQINTIGSSATPIPQRSSKYKLQYQTYWPTVGKNNGEKIPSDIGHLAFIRNFYNAMYKPTGGVPTPNEHTDGCYANYPDVDLGSGDLRNNALNLYFKDNLRNNPLNLVGVKKTWDPLNIFNHSQSIPLS